MSFKKRRHPTFGVCALRFGEVEQFPFYSYILSSFPPLTAHMEHKDRYLLPGARIARHLFSPHFCVGSICLQCLGVCRSCCVAAFGNQSGCFRSLGITNHASITCRSPHLVNLQKYSPLSARVPVLMQPTPKVIIWYVHAKQRRWTLKIALL